MTRIDPAVPVPAPRQAPPLPSAPGGERKGAVVRRRTERVVVAEGEERREERRDALATEEPLDIRVRTPDGTTLPVAVTMRTPGADFELAAGFLYAEGLIHSRDAVRTIRYCVDEARDGAQRYNVVSVELSPGTGFDAASLQRNFYVSSSCGVCGKASMDAVVATGCPRVAGSLRVTADLLLALPDRLREQQRVFDRTGGLHAAALFDACGSLLRLREDVGRHNALDKLVGASLLAGELPLEGQVVLVSGRLSFELVQKAARAGVAVLAGVSAPSSLAVELAERTGITLVGFLRGSSFNIYSGGERIISGVEQGITG